MNSNVIVIGAGPTGLVCALTLARAGVRARIIDKNSGPGLSSRAMGVQARTLEFYRQLGFAEEVVSKGLTIDSVHVRAYNQLAATVQITDFGSGLSPYPYILSFPQDEHERLLVDKLKEAGVDVEWNTSLSDLKTFDNHVQVTLQRQDSVEETYDAAYVCGCDGARSIVREDLHLAFEGGTYDKTYFVADVAASGEAAAGHTFTLCLGVDDLLLVLPVRSTGMYRLIGVVPPELHNRPTISFEDIRPFAEKAADIRVLAVNWFSTYHAHHRVAEHFRKDRVFIAGDAGHVHSPVGAQGMNTGIGDAYNLAWKIAAVVQGNAGDAILDTYEPERIAFAHALVHTTDKLFQLVTGSGLASHLFRENIFPHLIPFVMGFSAAKAKAFRLVSQTHIHYSGSALSEGQAGDLHGGDRLPWVTFNDGTDNYSFLESLDWQLHIYGEVSELLSDTAKNAAIPLHVFNWTDAAAKAGLYRDAMYFIRPDGYIGLIDMKQDVEKLTSYIAKFGIAVRH